MTFYQKFTMLLQIYQESHLGDLSGIICLHFQQQKKTFFREITGTYGYKQTNFIDIAELADI